MENGYGRVVGRIKDIIIRGGENIHPQEIEDYLMVHDSILEVAVSIHLSVRKPISTTHYVNGIRHRT